MLPTEKPMPRLRLLDEAVAEIRALDPDTSISRNFVRKLAISGQVATVQVGRKRLINLESLLEFLSLDNSNPNMEQGQDNHNKIRRIN